MNTVALAKNHQEALQSFLGDFERAGEASIAAFDPRKDETHMELLGRLAADERGENLPEDRVACTTRFLEANGELLGVFSLRHSLNEALRLQGGHVGYSVRPSMRKKGHGVRLLKAAMELARKLSIESILVTCDPENIGSSRIIEKCGGKIEDEFYHAPISRHVRRYWIEL